MKLEVLMRKFKEWKRLKVPIEPFKLFEPLNKLN